MRARRFTEEQIIGILKEAELASNEVEPAPRVVLVGREHWKCKGLLAG